MSSILGFSSYQEPHPIADKPARCPGCAQLGRKVGGLVAEPFLRPADHQTNQHTFGLS